jgi:hypothetical protein
MDPRLKAEDDGGWGDVPTKLAAVAGDKSLRREHGQRPFAVGNYGTQYTVALIVWA